MILNVEFSGGEHIESCCKEAQSLSAKLGVDVRFTFNGVDCIARPEGLPSWLVANFRQQLTHRVEFPMAFSDQKPIIQEPDNANE